MSPDSFALATPDRQAAVLAGTGEVLNFGRLLERSRALAAAMAAQGMAPRGHIAILLENRLEYFEVAWAAQRSGLYFTPVNWHLQASEVAHIVRDSGARWVFVSEALAHLIDLPTLPSVEKVVVVGGIGNNAYNNVLKPIPAEKAPVELEGQAMYYSSGTTGLPKGIKRDMPDLPFGTLQQWETLIAGSYGLDDKAVYLCPAPLYHAAPLGWSMIVQRFGGTVIVMERFDPEEVLRLIELHRVTHVQMVPTHFVKLLKLPEDVRERYDHSSLKTVVHAAAPCPIEVKEQMLAWWGPIIHEFYANSEGSGLTRIGPAEWLVHKGSVGKPAFGNIHILDEQGNPLPPGMPGVIWIEGSADFAYHNDPQKTAQAHDSAGRTSVGDMGYLDQDGYLYLTDRVSHMIISGGVNIYPQEIENRLITHPWVADVAVIGVPDMEYGERVLAVVVPSADAVPEGELAQTLIEYCRSAIAHYKCPRSVEFVTDLPRLPTGKLLKRKLRKQFAPLPTTSA